MSVNVYDDVIVTAFENYKFDVTVTSMTKEYRMYYESKGFKIYKSGLLYVISWRQPILSTTTKLFDESMHEYFSAEHLYMKLTNNNNLLSLTPNIVKNKLLKTNIIKDLFGTPTNTILSLYHSIIDNLLLSNKEVFISSGVLSLYPIYNNSIKLSYPVASVIIDDGYDLSNDFVNTNVTLPCIVDTDYTVFYNAAKGG